MASAPNRSMNTAPTGEITPLALLANALRSQNQAMQNNNNNGASGQNGAHSLRSGVLDGDTLAALQRSLACVGQQQPQQQSQQHQLQQQQYQQQQQQQQQQQLLSLILGGVNLQSIQAAFAATQPQPTPQLQQAPSQPEPQQALLTDHNLILARLAGARLLTGTGLQQTNGSLQGIAAPAPANQPLSRLSPQFNAVKPPNLAPQNANPVQMASRTLSGAPARPAAYHSRILKPQADSGSDDDPPSCGLEIAPGSTAIPCRARGMPMDHNPLTAYFVVSDKMKHGDDVVCSHPACRNAGVKFRYCSHCKAPVAKRNFRRRHNHGYTNEDDRYAHGDSVAEDKRAGADDERKMEGPQSKKIKTANVVPPETNSSTWQERVNEGPAKVDKLGQNRRLLWASLLEERPLTSDGESMSEWINKVLLVSDAAEQPFRPREEPVMIAPKKDLSNQD